MQRRGVERMIYSFDNSLKEITNNFPKRRKRMQQGSDHLSLLFIKNVHWKCEQNKGRRNKGHYFVMYSTSLLRTLFRRDARVQIPPPALFMSSFLISRRNNAFLKRVIKGWNVTRLTLWCIIYRADCFKKRNKSVHVTPYSCSESDRE